MKREQAEGIIEHLLDAAFELDEARLALAGIASDEDAKSLKAVITKLNSELLEATFERFPDLMPFEDFPEVNSTRRWIRFNFRLPYLKSSLIG